MVTAIFVGVLLALLLALAAAQTFLNEARARQGLTRNVLEPGHAGPSWLNALEGRLATTTPGRWVRDELQRAGLTYPLWSVLLVGGLVTVVVPYLLWVYVAPILAIAGLLAGWFGVRWWLKRARERYRAKFVDQIPDLARVLSNATSAGLSIRTAWTVAEREMGEPARREIARINTSVRFGASLEEAMASVEDRLPSREVKVLMSTLVIASRSGGSLVSALRDISYMLDERKETKREVKSVMAQAVATGYTLILFGVGVLFVVNLVSPGTIERITQNVFGLVALAVAASLMVVGHLLIRRITKVDL